MHKKYKLCIISMLICAIIGTGAGFSMDEKSNTLIYGLLNANGELIETYSVSIEDQVGEDLYKEKTEAAYKLPWHFSIQYKLDGKIIDPNLLGGQSGHLSLSIKIDENLNANSEAFSKMGLQVTLEMPADLIDKIQAPDAALAYKGNARQIIYTLLPGTTHDLKLECDVTNFEMSPIYISALPLSLKMDLPDAKESKSKYKLLKNGVKELDQGSARLSDASSKFLNGLQALTERTFQLKTELNKSLSKSDKIETLYQSNLHFINQLKEQAAQMKKTSSLETQGIKTQYETLQKTIGLLEANQKALKEQEAALEKVSKALEQLASQLQTLQTAMTSIHQGTQGLKNGTSKLKEEMLQGESDFQVLFNQLDQLSLTKKELKWGEPTQYVLRTASIKPPTEDQVFLDESPEKLSFWERVLKLIGL